jgi:hypothetical protein
MEEATKDLGMSSVCVSDEPNIEDIKSGKFHLIFGSAENVLDKCSVDALKYSSCHLRIKSFGCFCYRRVSRH